MSTSYPHPTVGSLMEPFLDIIRQFNFSDASDFQESLYPSMYSTPYNVELTEDWSSLCYNHCHAYAVNDHEPRIDEYSRPFGMPSTVINEQTAAVHTGWAENASTARHDYPIECQWRHNNSTDYEVIWEDNIDPDNMTYEELLDLGESVGIQSRGLSQEQISLLPVSKYKCNFFSRKKSRDERCVICQNEYTRGDQRITLPCKHVYHASCGTRWLSINKACPLCYTEVFADASKPKK